MRTLLIAGLFLCALALFAFAATAQDDPPKIEPSWDDLDAGQWTNIPGPEGTICSNGTPYSFYARPAEESSDKLLIHFQGGGACWMGENCSLEARPTYDPFVDESDDPTPYGGIADFANPENPFRDYNMVFAPYCTADVHIGSSTTTYEFGEGDDAGEVEIHHNGFDNASAVLAWTFENVPTASDVFVTGCSAGAMPSALYVLWVAQNYPDARIVQVGDAGGSYRNVTGILTEMFHSWGTFDILGAPFADVPEAEMTFETFYSIVGNLFPDIQFAQYNAAFDGVQTGFIVLAGLGDPNTYELQQLNHADIRAALDQDNFSVFTAGGSGHCITVTPEMYTITAGGVRFVDWLTALARGVPVGDVTCTGTCRRADHVD